MLSHKIGTFWRINYTAKTFCVNPLILYKFSFLNLYKATIFRVIAAVNPTGQTEIPREKSKGQLQKPVPFTSPSIA